MTTETTRILDAITDAALFERLATAVLREAVPEYRSLVHTGVNAEGKTIKSPIDGITLVSIGPSVNLIAVHHTICELDDLERKWLLDPATAKLRKPTSTRPPPGDLLKTAEVFAEEKAKLASIKGTLVLTTNRDPGEDLVRRAHEAARKVGLDLDIWPRSRIAHFLDTTAEGQWIRRSYLGIEQQRLSGELLKSLSEKSLDLNRPPGDPGLWVDRGADSVLTVAKGRDVLILVAPSGLGKSVACYRRLQRHVADGGTGVILTHTIVANATSLDHAITLQLEQLHPSLIAGSGSEVRDLVSESMPFLVVVEDINRSPQPSALLEKIGSWKSTSKEEGGPSPVNVICPTWPRIFDHLGESVRKDIERMCLSMGTFTKSEAAQAVLARYGVLGKQVTPLEAAAIAESLANEPLLIALHEPSIDLDAHSVLSGFVERSLRRLFETKSTHTSGELREALRALAGNMLLHRRLEPSWLEILEWFSGATHTVSALRQLCHDAQVVRLETESARETLRFRHDRVRDTVLVEALANMLDNSGIPDTILADPFYADVIGQALAMRGTGAIGICSDQNPLALVCAFRAFREPTTPAHHEILRAIDSWLSTPATHVDANRQLRWAAMQVLSEVEASRVVDVVSRLDDGRDWPALFAGLRNGKTESGIAFCLDVEPGVGVIGLPELLDHVRRKHSAPISHRLSELLGSKDTEASDRVGALRLCGHLRNPALADAIETSWKIDPARLDNLAEYLWAGAQCGGENPAQLLDPVCVEWALLSDKNDDKGMPGPRLELAAYHIKWAFNQHIPSEAVRYFLGRAATEDLRWPITYMLETVDHPDAVAFIASELAEAERRLEGTGSFSPFSLSITSNWRRRQEDTGRAMSEASRDRLLSVWSDNTQGDHERRQALRLWCGTTVEGDTQFLQTIEPGDPIFWNSVWQRLLRGDAAAIPALLEKLKDKGNGQWWQMAKHVWSNDLSAALDAKLAARGQTAPRSWEQEYADEDWTTADIIMWRPTPEAEQILLKHWDHLQFAPRFIQAALFVATPRLVPLVAKAVASSPKPQEIFQFLAMRLGLMDRGHPGVTRRAQMEAILPYVDRLDGSTISSLWQCCNVRGWRDLRALHLDARLEPGRRDASFVADAAAFSQLDDITSESSIPSVDLWIKDYLKTGASLDEVVGVVGRWLAQRGDIPALRTTTLALIHFGQRRHLPLLETQSVENRIAVEASIANAVFAVRRRSLE